MSIRAYRRRLCILLAVSLLFITAFYLYELRQKIPDHITIEAGNTSSIPASAAHISVDDMKQLSMSETGSYQVEYKLLGFMGIKNVQVEVIEGQEVYVGGMPVGIYVQTQGMMVVGSGAVTGIDGVQYEPAANIMQSGDYITAINGKEVSTKEEFIQTVNEEGAEPVILDIFRNGEKSKVKLTPVQTGREEYRLGIWIRDNTQGVGMLTFMTKDGRFGALGHGITDVDTGLLMNIDKGRILDTEIISIVKGKSGSPGELVGMIDYREEYNIGMVLNNTPKGIFGKIDENALGNLTEDAMRIGWKQEMHTGKAQIRTCIDGDVQDYDVNILEIDLNSREHNKSFLLEITDERLLEKTGGIVQGMSGSPVIQDGKLVGAVTHVLVQDSTKGYGIFIEEMLKECQ